MSASRSISGSSGCSRQFHSFIGVNPLQTTWTEHGIVSGREALLLRSAEIQPLLPRFSDWTFVTESPNPPTTPFPTGSQLLQGGLAAAAILGSQPSFFSPAFTAHVGARQQAAAQLLGGRAINSISWKSVVDKNSLVEKESPLITNFQSARFSALRTGLVIMKGLRLRLPG